MILAALAFGATCSVPAGWAAVETRHTPFVILGEKHGTVQGPATLATLACALSARGERLLIALEQDAGNDDALNAAWSLSSSEDFAVAVPRVLHWQGRDDGNGSRATLAMLVALHRLKARGGSIDLVAFNGRRDDAQAAQFKDLPGQNPHEAMQAENIQQAAGRHRYDHVLVLVGNFHARKRPAELAGTTVRPMAMRLAPPQHVTSLRLAFGPGTSWGCHLRPGVKPGPGQEIADGDLDCGAHANARDPGAFGRQGIRIGDPPGHAGDGHDGWWHVGASTASPPALPGRP